MRKIPVGVLGATGMVGQQYLHLLESHPWFEVTFLAASDLSANKSYEEAVSGRWHMSKPIPESLGSMNVYAANQIDEAKKKCSILFSAMSNEGANEFEERYAEAGLCVFSNASYHRKTQDVPILIPEVNPEHADIIPLQRKNRGWDRGCIVVKPNCSVQSYMIPLAPLHAKFSVEKLLITTLQATSGAGYPGVSSFDLIDNVIPYIANEEEKSEQEPLKIWGSISQNTILSAQSLSISATCTRAPVLDGHLACVSVQFKEKPSRDEILSLWEEFQPLPQKKKLPSAPLKPILYRPEPDRPQPRLDRYAGSGMAVTVGRLRPCPIFDWRFVGLSHNTIRGAAGGGILNAELLVELGLVNTS